MKKVLFATFIALSLISGAQENSSIVTDRPTQSASAFVAPGGQLLIETGFLRTKVSESQTFFTYPNVLMRFGIIKGVELRLSQDYLGTEFLGMKFRGFSPVTLGTKVHLVDEEAWKPQISLLGQVTLKGGSGNFNLSKPIKEFRLNFQNTLSKKVTLGYNVGNRFSDGSSSWFSSVVASLLVADQWTVFAEPYAFFGEKSFNGYFNAGIIFLATDKLQFDASFGLGDSGFRKSSFVGLGVAVGFN